MGDPSEPSPPSAKDLISARTWSTRYGKAGEPPGDGRPPAALHIQLLDRGYAALLGRSNELTASLDPAIGVTVSGMVRSAPDRVLICLMEHEDLGSRYAVELPILMGEGQVLSHMDLVRALRHAYSHKNVHLQDKDAERDFHGAPIFPATCESTGELPADGAVVDSIYLTLRSLAINPAVDLSEREGREVFSLHGFSYFSASSFRVYLWELRSGEVIGVDLPIAERTEMTHKTASVSILAELSSLFRNGIPRNVASREIHADSYSSHVYDLRSWFLGVRTQK